MNFFKTQPQSHQLNKIIKCYNLKFIQINKIKKKLKTNKKYLFPITNNLNKYNHKNTITMHLLKKDVHLLLIIF